MRIAVGLIPPQTGAIAIAASALPAQYAVTSRIAGPDGGWDYASVDPAAAFAPGAKPGDRPVATSGSFHVLIIERAKTIER